MIKKRNDPEQNYNRLVARREPHLSSERSEARRSGAKWRGRGLVQRNTEMLDFTLIERAESQTRTDDLLITNQLLYQLSYFGLRHLLIGKIKMQEEFIALDIYLPFDILSTLKLVFL